jgi:hypothetical protein
MAGLVPAIHVFARAGLWLAKPRLAESREAARTEKVVDGRDKPGHDG